MDSIEGKTFCELCTSIRAAQFAPTLANTSKRPFLELQGRAIMSVPQYTALPPTVAIAAMSLIISPGATHALNPRKDKFLANDTTKPFQPTPTQFPGPSGRRTTVP